MVTTAEKKAGQQAKYLLEGTLLEACSCGVLCPCWVGEDPDGGECFSFMSYHFDRGSVDGTDVSGLSIVNAVHIPGNVLAPGTWKIVMFIDSKATPAQKDALVAAYTGKLGGPLADLAGLVGEVLGVESAEIKHQVVGGKGTLSVGDMISAEMEPYRGGDGTATTLRDSIFSTVPGSPAYVGKASRQRVNLPKYNMVWDYHDTNAIQADYKMEFMG